MADLFKAPDNDGTANQLADHLPVGDVWAAKNVQGTNLRALVKACAVPFNYVQAKIEELQKEFNIDTSTLLLPEWEDSVGIPDCIEISGQTLTQRRNAVKRRLRKEPIVTLEDMQAYLDELVPDSGVVLRKGVDVFNFEYDFEIEFIGNINDKFIIVVEVPSSEPFFEYEFEMDFTGATNTDIIECILRRVVPCNVYLYFREV